MKGAERNCKELKGNHAYSSTMLLETTSWVTVGGVKGGSEIREKPSRAAEMRENEVMHKFKLIKSQVEQMLMEKMKVGAALLSIVGMIIHT